MLPSTLPPRLLLTAAAIFATAGAWAQAPRLTVVIIAEQFRADYLDRFRNDFGGAGFRRLMEGGARFRRARFDYSATWASPGVATLAAGAYPAEHGIVADHWFDRDRGRVVDAAGDPGDPGADLLRGSTIADELNLAADRRSRVVAIGERPASTVLAAGRRPRGCYWRGADGAFRTSIRYAQSLPDWARVFNEAHPLTPERAPHWFALGAPKSAAPLRSLQPDFLPIYSASPFAVNDLFAFARAAIENERLGERDFPDLLFIVPRATALLALETGSESPLMRDMAAHFDRSLGSFLNWLDDRLGLDEAAVVFTAAHGISPRRADLSRSGLEGGTVSGDAVAARVDEALRERYGGRLSVEKFVYPSIYLTSAAREMGPAQRAEALRTAGEAALGAPGVAAYYSPEVSSASRDLRARMSRAFAPGRSGDLLLAYEPYWTEAYGDGRGLAPGSPYRYDADVPLILFGRRFRPGLREASADPRALAATLAALLGIAAPSGSAAGALLDVLLPETAPSVGPQSPPLD